ncbi:MAG: DUF4091 domain-containing protein [Clostridiales bacterium]|nr:DUF4091 domain-containing protein [Clostridiales bacterium]
MFMFGNGLLSLKRVIGSILVAVLSLGYSLGLSFDFQGVYYDKSSVVTYCFYDSTHKIDKKEFLGKTKTYDIKLARNEYEACQIAIRSKFNSPSRKYTIEFTQFKNESGDVLESAVFEEKYITCVSDKNYGTYPDALIPFTSGEQRNLGYAQNWPFYIRVRADENTPAGTYSAQITVKSLSDGDKVQLVADVTATVWDFDLPVTPSCETAFGLSRYNIAKTYYTQGNPEREQELYEKYYEFLLDHKISPYGLPVDILSSEADAYMSDPRVTSFLIPYPASDDALSDYYQKVRSNPEWAAKGYFYPIDEPGGLEAYGKYTAITDRLARVCPGYNMVTPANMASFKEDGKTYYTTELQAGRSNILCGISDIFAKDSFLKQVDERRADGTKIWWYVCCGPQDDYCNIFIHFEGIKGRLLLWQQKERDITGLLYWDTTFWRDVISPWGDALTTPWTGNTAFGDGSLMYPGQDGPVTTLRLEEVSDGIDDYEYLTIAEELFGKEYIDKKIAKLTNTMTDYTLNDSLLTKVRAEIGGDIERELSGTVR